MSEICGFVVPTLGTRNDLLIDCLKSIRSNNVGWIVLVKPKDVLINDQVIIGLVDSIVTETGKNLANAINCGVEQFPCQIQYFGWVGDDDLLLKECVSSTLEIFGQHNDTSLVYGNCNYIDLRGNVLGTNQVGPIAIKLLGFAPCLIPQPGSLILVDAFKSVGGLNESFKFAFDLDLYLRMAHNGHLLRYVDKDLANFRWHSDSLTSGMRRLSIKDAKIARRENANKRIKFLLLVTEPLNHFASVLSSAYLRLRMKRFQKF